MRAALEMAISRARRRAERMSEMTFTKRDAELYFANSERIDVLRGRIEGLLGRIRNEFETKFKSVKPQGFGYFPVPGTEFTLECFSVEMRRGEFCTNIIRLVGPSMRSRAYVHGHDDTIPADLVGPVYGILPAVMSHFSELWPEFGLSIKDTIDIEI